MFDALIQDLAVDLALRRDVRSVFGEVDDLEDAYHIQDRLRPHLGAICGRKIAANSPALMTALDMDVPIVGLITGQITIPTRSELHLSDYAQLALEPEFAAVIGREVPPGTVLSTKILGDYVDRFSMAFEVLDCRNNMNSMHAPTFIVNNLFNAGVVLDHAAIDMDALDRKAFEATFKVGDKILFENENNAPQNPLEACAFVINHFTARGEAVKVGEVILCGAHHPPTIVGDEGCYVFTLCSGEEVSLSILR